MPIEGPAVPDGKAYVLTAARDDRSPDPESDQEGREFGPGMLAGCSRGCRRTGVSAGNRDLRLHWDHTFACASVKPRVSCTGITQQYTSRGLRDGLRACLRAREIHVLLESACVALRSRSNL